MQVFATYLPATVTYAPPPNGNPGIVPPWLQKPMPGAPPADDPTPRVMGAAHPTVYDPETPRVGTPEYPYQPLVRPQLWNPEEPQPVDPDIPRIM